MKKRLFLLAAVLLSVLMANADYQVIINVEDYASPSFTSAEGIVFTADNPKPSSSAPRYYANGTDRELRFFANNTLTVTCDSMIKSIVFELSSDGISRATNITASDSSECVTDASIGTVSWEGKTNSVMFTVGAKTIDSTAAGRLCFTKVYIELFADTLIAPEPIKPVYDTLTVAQAVEIASALDDRAQTDDEYVVLGYVTSIEEAYNVEHNNVSFWIADVKDEAGTFEVFRAEPLAEADAAVKKGDLIEAKGWLKNYKGTPELGTGGVFSILEAAPFDSVPADTIDQPIDTTVIDTTVIEPVEIKDITVAEFITAADLQAVYRLTGVVANIKNTTYGNFDLVDETGSVYIYGLLTADSVSKQFPSMDIAEGDTLTLLAVYSEYNGSPQVKNAVYVSHVKGVTPEPELISASIAEFLAAADPVNLYELTGVVANIVNTTYGNFDLVDGDASVYIYGLLTADGVSKQFESMDIAEGDTLTLRGQYSVFKDAPQIKNAVYVSHRKLQIESALELVEANSLVALNGGELTVKAHGNVRIYNVAGQLIYSFYNDGQRTVAAIERGQILIVRVGEKVAKVVL